MSLFVTNKIVITFFCFLFPILVLICPLFGKTKNLPDPKNPLQESINFIEKICGDRKLVRNVVGPVREKDILILLESEREARRLR